MSTEVSRRLTRATRRYRRTVLATLGVLALATTGLGIAGAFRGPGLDEASVAAASALERPGQRLALQADQALAPVIAGDVRITPDVPFAVDASGPTVTIRFDGMLRALTDYDVRVAVTGAATGIESTLDYRFTTPDLSVAVLVRDPSGPDEVRRRTVSGRDAETLFAADRIQEFALAPTGVVAVVLDDDTPNGRVVFQAEGQDLQQDIALPGVGRATDLHASATTGRVGFLFSSADVGDPAAPVAQLELLDPANPSGVPTTVLGLDGQPLSVLDWAFVPGTAYLVAQGFDQQLLLVDTATGAAPVPLGQHVELRGFVPGTVRLVVADPTAGGLLDLASGDLAVLDLPSDDLDLSAYPGKLLVLGPDSYVEVVSRPVPGEGYALDPELLLVGPDGPSVLYDPPAGATVRDICLSPNAQYVAVELGDANGTTDGYPNVSGWTDVTTYFVDLTTGAANRGIEGFAPSWCD